MLLLYTYSHYNFSISFSRSPSVDPSRLHSPVHLRRCQSPPLSHYTFIFTMTFLFFCFFLFLLSYNFLRQPPHSSWRRTTPQHTAACSVGDGEQHRNPQPRTLPTSASDLRHHHLQVRPAAPPSITVIQRTSSCHHCRASLHETHHRFAMPLHPEPLRRMQPLSLEPPHHSRHGTKYAVLASFAVV